jgi:DNA-binding MarR family transcriptional regulator
MTVSQGAAIETGGTSMSTQRASVTDAQRKLLRAQLNALKPFRAVRETMPLQYVTAFLLVATEEHLNVSEYAKRAGTSQSLMTRHLADLGAVNRYHEDGFDLVEGYEDIMDRRNRLMRLTTRGKHVAWEMCEALKNA